MKMGTWLNDGHEMVSDQRITSMRQNVVMIPIEGRLSFSVRDTRQ